MKFKKDAFNLKDNIQRGREQEFANGDLQDLLYDDSPLIQRCNWLKLDVNDSIVMRYLQIMRNIRTVKKSVPYELSERSIVQHYVGNPKQKRRI